MLEERYPDMNEDEDISMHDTRDKNVTEDGGDK